MFWLWLYEMHEMSMHHYYWTGDGRYNPRDDKLFWGILNRFTQEQHYTYFFTF